MTDSEFHQQLALQVYADLETTNTEVLERMMGSKCPDWLKEPGEAQEWHNKALGRFIANTASQILAGYNAQMRGV